MYPARQQKRNIVIWRVTVVENSIVIEAADKPRAGWTEAALMLHERREDSLLDEVVLTDFDESEWVWE
jgi:hypothetical protein